MTRQAARSRIKTNDYRNELAVVHAARKGLGRGQGERHERVLLSSRNASINASGWPWANHRFHLDPSRARAALR
jgi:hypothetical protein